MKRFVSILLIATLLAAPTGCGTLIHPERKGQIGGDFDLNIVILDGIGLIFFLIPGVIAYAVDLNNGTIYLPEGRGQNIGYMQKEDMDTRNMRAVKTGMRRDEMTEQNIRREVEQYSGRKVPAGNKNMEVYAVDPEKGIKKRVYPEVAY